MLFAINKQICKQICKQLGKQTFYFIILIFLSACATQSIPTEDESRKIKTAKINAQLGMSYLEQHDVIRAKQKLLLALDQEPEIPETLYSMAYFFESTGDIAKANQYYLKALKVAPKRGDVNNNYGTYLCRMGQYQKSIQYFLIAANDTNYLNPADAYENAGLCALKMNARKQAKIYFQHAINQDPTRTTSMLAMVELNYHAGQIKIARKMLNRFLSISAPTPQSIKLNTLLDRTQQTKSKILLATKESFDEKG